VKPLGTFDPLQAQVHHFRDLWGRSRKLEGLDKLRVWVKGPDWGYPAAPEVTRAEQRKHAVKLSRNQVIWLAVNFVITIALTTYLMWNRDVLPLPEKLFVAGFLLMTLAAWGALLERRRWLLPVELARAATAAAAVLLIIR
jgi:hypothetical protein